MAETAARQPADTPPGRTLLPRLREIPLDAAGVTLVVLLGAYLGSIAVTGDPGPLVSEDAPFGLHVVFRMNLVLIAITTYSLCVGLLDFRSAPRELGRLRELLECDDATFEAAVAASLPTRAEALSALALGGAFGSAVPLFAHLLATATGQPFDWDLHASWTLGLMILLFGLLGLFALWSTRSARLYSSLARIHARVELLDTAPFQLFATRGLRLALFWFLGSGIALMLTPGARPQALIVGVIAITSALGAASLVLPCLGIRQRIKQAKAAELARVRGEIEARLAALRDGYTERSIELPGLLAWEARVADVPEWPFGTPVLLRFVLLVLIPLGSWLGGAMVERLLEGVLG